ncbi:MAG: SDR family oxidoreductase [Acidimicrobiia bacterium]
MTGTSSGIGRACVAHLHRSGWRVFAGVRTEADGAEVAALGPGVVPVHLDVTDDDAVRTAVDLVAADVGESGLDAVVNNAGVALGGPVETTPLATWREVLEVNLLGQLAVTRATIPLVRTARGRYVFVGSANGRLSGPLLGAYAASKHGLEAACEALRHELRPSGVKVLCVEPGAVRTEIWPKVRREVEEISASLDDAAQARYAPMADAIGELARSADAHGVAPARVAEVVGKLLDSPHPPARRLVGADAWVMGLGARLLPDSLRDRLVRGQLGLGWR